MRCLFTWCLPSSRWRKRILSDSETRKMCRRTWTCQWPEIQNYKLHRAVVVVASKSMCEYEDLRWAIQFTFDSIYTDRWTINTHAGCCRLRVQEIAILMYFWLGLMEIDKPSGKYFSFVRIIFHTKENIIIQILQEFNMELWKCF